MKKNFYTHLIDTSSLSLALGDMEMSREERLHLVSIMESSLHHAILDTILSELSEEDKKKFLEHLASDDNERVWEFLDEKIDKIEEKVKKTAEDLKKELHKDIEEK